MHTQIIRVLGKKTPKPPPRLGWLFSPFPAYGETVSWLRRPRGEAGEYLPNPLQPCTVGVLFSPFPAYREPLAWLRRPRGEAGELLPNPLTPDTRGVLFSNYPAYGEILTWLRPRLPDTTTPQEVVRPRLGGLGSLLPFPELIVWRRQPAATAESGLEIEGRRAWLSPSIFTTSLRSGGTWQESARSLVWQEVARGLVWREAVRYVTWVATH